MVSKNKIFAGIILILLIVIFSFLFFYKPKENSFSVETLLLKSNVNLGETYKYSVTVKNNEDFSKKFNASVEENEKELFYIPDKNFAINPHEEKEVSLFFNDLNRDVAIYSSEFVISDGKTEKRIPIIVTVEDNKNLLSIMHSAVANSYNTYPGGKFAVDIKLFDLNDLGIPSLKANSYIQNIQGDILWTNEEDLVISGTKTELISIPKSWNKGTYIFVTSVEYKDVKSLSGYVFVVGDKEYNPLQNFNTKFLILIVMIFLLGLIILFFYLIKSRDEFLTALKKQQNQELAKSIKLIKCSRNKILKSKQNFKEKKKRIKKLNEAKREILSNIKKKQALQKRELKKLHRSKAKKTIQEKLSSWKKQGYQMIEAKKGLSDVEKGKKQIEKWKRQRYKF